MKNKNIYALAFLMLSVFFVSCVDEDDNKIDKEWKKMNEDAYLKAYSSKDYYKLESQSRNGTVLWKTSNLLTDDQPDFGLRINSQGNPEYTDSVTVRYEGWYIQKDGTSYTFDTTEEVNNKVPRGFAVKNVVDGWTTVLQDMKVGEERELVIPWILGYGSSGLVNSGVVVIPAYTTLYFRMKLLDIHQMSGTTK